MRLVGDMKINLKKESSNTQGSQEKGNVDNEI